MARSQNRQLNPIHETNGSQVAEDREGSHVTGQSVHDKCPVTDLEDPENLQCPITVLQCPITEKGKRKMP